MLSTVARGAVDLFGGPYADRISEYGDRISEYGGAAGAHGRGHGPR
ncbi:hypothetical protein [Streptomyces sp. NPDC006527]